MEVNLEFRGMGVSQNSKFGGSVSQKMQNLGVVKKPFKLGATFFWNLEFRDGEDTKKSEFGGGRVPNKSEMRVGVKNCSSPSLPQIFLME